MENSKMIDEPTPSSRATENVGCDILGSECLREPSEEIMRRQKYAREEVAHDTVVQ